MSGAEVLAVIGIGASIIQVVDGCNKVLNRIEQFRKNMAFQDLELQLPLLMKDIESLNSPEYSVLIDEATEKALVRVLEGCRRQVNALDQLIQSLTPSMTASKLQRTWKGIKSFRKDTKLREILGILAEYKATIILHLSSRHMQASQKQGKSAEAPRSYFEVPAQRVSHFVGRREVLEKIKSSIVTSEASPAVVVLTGVGGQGKTQIALEFCRKSNSNFNTIFWIDASSKESARRSFENIAGKISQNINKFSGPDSKITFVKESLRDWPQPWLLVFDNYDDPKAFRDIASFFPASSSQNKNAILVTSRHTLSERLGTAIKLNGLSENEAVELLLARCPSLLKDADHSNAEKEIVKKLGYLALAIDQAAAYISIRQLPLQLFLSHYEKRKEVILNHAPDYLWEYRKNAQIDTQNQELNLSVLTTWELSFEQIGADEREREFIGDFLTQSAFFNPTSISEDLFKTFFTYRRRHPATLQSIPPWIETFLASESQGWDSFLFQDVVIGLMNLSLIQSVEITSSDMRFSLHPLIKVRNVSVCITEIHILTISQDWLQLRRSTALRRGCTTTAIKMTSDLIIVQDVESLALQSRQQLLAHADTCIENYRELKDRTNDKMDFGGLLEGCQTTFATFYGRHDRYQDAEKLFLETLDCQLRRLGQLNLATLRTMNNLAAMYLDVRNLERAEPLLLETLEKKEEVLGPRNPITLNTVNNLGNLYAMQSLFDKATDLYTRTLHGYAETYGPNHKTVIEAYNNLGEVAMKRGRLGKANSMFKTAMVRIRSMEETDLTLYIKSNIAVVLKLQGKYRQSIRLYEKVIQGRESLLGTDHSSTLMSMCELGDVYLACGQGDKADEWYSRGKADDIRRRQGSRATMALNESHDIYKSPVPLDSLNIGLETPRKYEIDLKWDDPGFQSYDEIIRSGRRRNNELAQAVFRRKRQHEQSDCTLLEGDLAPHEGTSELTSTTARGGGPTEVPTNPIILQDSVGIDEVITGGPNQGPVFLPGGELIHTINTDLGNRQLDRQKDNARSVQDLEFDTRNEKRSRFHGRGGYNSAMDVQRYSEGSNSGGYSLTSRYITGSLPKPNANKGDVPSQDLSYPPSLPDPRTQVNDVIINSTTQDEQTSSTKSSSNSQGQSSLSLGLPSHACDTSLEHEESPEQRCNDAVEPSLKDVTKATSVSRLHRLHVDNAFDGPGDASDSSPDRTDPRLDSESDSDSDQDWATRKDMQGRRERIIRNSGLDPKDYMPDRRGRWRLSTHDRQIDTAVLNRNDSSKS
jgi:tetratricopeptide (TPR) repeat protein